MPAAPDDGDGLPEMLGTNDWDELSEAVIEDYLAESGLEWAHLLGLLSRHDPVRSEETSRQWKLGRQRRLRWTLELSVEELLQPALGALSWPPGRCLPLAAPGLGARAWP
jgi:hypothetical protein